MGPELEQNSFIDTPDVVGGSSLKSVLAYLSLGVLWVFFCLSLNWFDKKTSMAVLLIYSLLWLLVLIFRPRCHTLKLAVVLWLLTRSFCFVGPSFYENDYYRYLWDGLVTLSGQNALMVSPLEVSEERPTFGLALEEHLNRQMLIDDRLEILPEVERQELLGKINFPESPSIYGPAGQIFLAMQSIPLALYRQVYPDQEIALSWRVQNLRVFFLLLDLLSCYLLLKGLRMSGQSNTWLAIYILCPVLLKEVGNSLHIDLLSTVFGMLAFNLLCAKRYMSSAIFLALGTGVKMYALVLLPFYLIWSRSLKFFLVYLFGLCLLYLPFVWSGGEEIWLGTRYFSDLWSMNDFFPALLRELLYSIMENEWHPVEAYPIGVYERSSIQLLSRQISLGCFVVFAIFLFIRSLRKDVSMKQRCTTLSWMIMAVFWFSPVQNPWYYLWGLPFFILSGRKIILLMVGLSQLYLFNFYLEPTSHMFEPFQWWVMLPHVVAGLVWLYRRWKGDGSETEKGVLCPQ